ncbi:DUF58 domain-containing protein [Mycobacterium cookii]|uniref:DUF58 domain-containing protein n=1 Tax=Nocardioides furvisabuli TaxID=375542 RepID=A0ABN2WVI1_9ACTN
MAPAVLRGATAAVRRRVTPTGWGLGGLALVAAWLGERYQWTELVHLAATVGVVLALGAVTVLLPRRAVVELELRPSRVTVGDGAVAALDVRAHRLPLLAPTFVVPTAGDARGVRPSLVTTTRPARVDLTLPTEHRGLVDVGPAVHVRTDLFGAFRRERAVTPTLLLHVRPRIAHLPSLSAGMVHDLEGVPSDRLTASDFSFHALREYVPGDDPRHVHWKSSARAGSLLVRQFQLTRHSHASVLLDPHRDSYVDSAEFELAVSAATSVAVRAAQDGFEVAFACGDEVTVTTEVSSLLDLACRFTWGSSDLQHTCARVSGGMGGSSLVATVTGSRADGAAVRRAVSHFPTSADVLSVRADHGAEPRTARSGRSTSLVVDDLPHLASLLAKSLG